MSFDIVGHQPVLAPLVVGLLLGAVALLCGAIVGLRAYRRTIDRATIESAELLADAAREAESLKQEHLLQAQEKVISLEEEFETRERDLETREASVETRQAELNRLKLKLDQGKNRLDNREKTVSRIENATRKAEEEAVRKERQATATLERIAGLSSTVAKAELIATIEEEARLEGARLARKIEDESRENAEREGINLLVQAMERVNLQEITDSTVTYIQLPSDEMKGRIIGREGRNIRALENVTGIDLIVDDTPRAILVSCFDPVRREIARLSIERLVEDGRIHPARIEEVVEKTRSEIDSHIEEIGNQAAFSLGITDLHPKLARRIGRMKYGSNRGHNLLQHCLEVALLAGNMASEVGANVDVVHRAGLFHEIGRMDNTVSGHTLLASAELAGRYHDNDEVTHAIQALHPDVKEKSVEALLVQAANRISDNRPGACKDNLEIFIERLRRIESIANEHEGVVGSYAVKAGKEIRVLVDAKHTDDDTAYDLSKRIARRLEGELAYPGQIKVSVIRETRATRYAI